LTSQQSILGKNERVTKADQSESDQQGCSTLTANPSGFFNWRQFREEGEEEDRVRDGLK